MERTEINWEGVEINHLAEDSHQYRTVVSR